MREINVANRNKLLAGTDFLMLEDARYKSKEITPAFKAQLKIYRQWLRDLPESDPDFNTQLIYINWLEDWDQENGGIIADFLAE